MQRISSPQNPRIKAVVRLRESRVRRRERRIVIDGIREIGRAAAAGFPLVEVYAGDDAALNPAVHSLLEAAGAAGAELFEVPLAVLGKISYGERTEGIVAVAEWPDRSLDSLPEAENPLIVVLEGIEKPGNLGAVIRTADGAGATAVIAAEGNTDLYNPNAIRASLGTIFSLPILSAGNEETLAWLRRREIPMFAARVDGRIAWHAAALAGPAALVLGSEAEGLSTAWHGEDITAVSLPMLGAADSLNVSATAAVLLYEAVRQRSS